MKTKITLLTLAALAAVSALPAQETVKKERRVVAERIGHEPMEKREPATFLGVETIPVNPTITEQLSLPKGVGLIVRSVVPDSPAAAALKPHDILTKLDDQLLIETRQLAVLIRSHKENDEVSLTYVRGGKETTAKVKLTKRDLPKEFGHRFEGGPMENHMFFGAPAGMPSDAMTIRPGGVPAARVRVLKGGPRFTAGTQLNLQDSKLLYSDDKGSLEVTTADGKRTVVAKNPKGDVVYNGPIDTPEQREAVPQDVRERLDRMEHVDHLTFEHLAPPPPPEAGAGGPQAMELIRRLHRDGPSQDGMLM